MRIDFIAALIVVFGSFSTLLSGDDLPVEEILFDESDSFQLYARPQIVHPGFAATVVGVRAKGPIVSIHDVGSFFASGEVHQTWLQEPSMQLFIVPSPFRIDLYEWQPTTVPLEIPQVGEVDSHVITYCGVEASCWERSVFETNDGANPAGLPHEVFGSLDGRVDNFFEVFGIGDIYMPSDTGGILLEDERSEMDVLYLVTRANELGDEPLGAINLSISVSGFDSGGRLDRSRFSDLQVPFVAVPDPDFDDDGFADVTDIDALTSHIAVGTHDSIYDLTIDGVVDDRDLSEWRLRAARLNGFAYGSAFLVGDANLDGVVDAADLNQVGGHWFSNTTAWSAGNFSGDDAVDAADLNELALNWNKSIPPGVIVVPVPEPSSAVLLLGLIYAAISWRRRGLHIE